MSDRTSFKKAVLPHLDHLHAVARSMIRDRSRTGELVMQTLITARDRFDRNATQGHIRSWLTDIMKSLWTDQFQETRCSTTIRRDHEPEVLRASGSDLGTAEEPEVPDLFQRDDVREALMNIPAKFRRTLILASMEEMDEEKLARELDLSISTVRHRIVRGRRLLKSELDSRMSRMEPFRRGGSDGTVHHKNDETESSNPE